MSEIQLSERMQRLIEKKGGIPGVDSVSLPREQKTETVPSTETEKKIDEYSVGDDLSLVLAVVSREDRSDTTRYLEHKEKVNEANNRLKEHGVDVDSFTRRDIQVGTEEGNKVLGQRKAVLREMLVKIKEDKDLNDEEKKIVDIINLKVSDLRRNEEFQGEIKKEKQTTIVPKQEKENPPQEERKKSETDQRLENIGRYPALLEQRRALMTLRDLLVKKGASPEDIEKVNGAARALTEKENQRIQEYREKGEMRPELEESLSRYNVELEKAYDMSANIINVYQMSPMEGVLTRSLAEVRSVGVDGEDLAKELEKELLDMGLLHDLRLMVNSRGAVDDSMLKYASELKGKQFDRLIHLQDRMSQHDNDGVTLCLAKIDEEARRSYNDIDGNKNNIFKLEDPNLEDRVLEATKSNRLHYLIARDLYRVTGGEARYGVAGYAHQDGSKGNAWVIEKNGDDNNGAFFRKAMNKRRDLVGAVDSTASGNYVLRYWPELWKHLDPGVSSFWEKLWSDAEKAAGENASFFKTQSEIRMKVDNEVGIPPREYAVLTVEALRNLRLGVEEPGKVSLDNEIAFNTWLETIGKVSTTMSKEIQYMSNPNFKSFQSILGVDYYPVIMRERLKDGKKIRINREQYLLERLGDLVENYKKSQTMSLTQMAKELNEYRVSGFLFRTDEELKDFKKRYGIPEGGKAEDLQNLKDFGKKLTGKDSGARKVAGSVAGDILEKILKGGF